MTDWADEQAEKIVDAFVTNDTSDDLLKLQEAVAEAIRRAYERGKKMNPTGLAFVSCVISLTLAFLVS